MSQTKAEWVAELSVALTTLEQFEKFFANYTNGRYVNIAGMPTREKVEVSSFIALTDSLDTTKALILQHIIDVATKSVLADSSG